MMASLLVLWLTAAPAQPLRSIRPEEVLTRLDLSSPALAAVRQAAEKGDRRKAMSELLAHYRQRYPLAQPRPAADRATLAEADAIARHVFQWGPYPPADYGPDIDWAADPRGDIEWVAAVYRFYWARPLAEAWYSSGDDKYVKAFVELATDFIGKHPLEEANRVHPVYTHWRGFPWLDIQTGVRAEMICDVFPLLVHGPSFTPEFLEVLLASLYDHQVKTERYPMGSVHNKAVFEQRGFVEIAATFPEFRDSRRWMELGLARTRDTFLAQTTTDGVQREWSFGYHLGVLSDAVGILRSSRTLGVAVPQDYRDRIRAMYDYVFAIATPELAGPMFGDASRKSPSTADRRNWPLYDTLVEASQLLEDPKYAALAANDAARLPAQTSYGFPEAGTYVLRDQWGPQQIYFALHCPPRGISGHDQNDNGTFELAAFGRWLMPDTGFYTYGHDPEARRWHRQTRVHQTLTLDGADSQIDGRTRAWDLTPGQEVVVVENEAYRGVIHRRSVWFAAEQFFVILDEALGSAPGERAVHFQLAPGEAEINADEHWATTRFDDANVLVWQDPAAAVQMVEEDGFHAWTYGKREPRKAFRFAHQSSGDAVFLTVIVPYRGTERPAVAARLDGDFRPGDARAAVTVTALGKTWQLERSLASP